MTVVLSGTHLRKDRSKEAVAAMAEYMAHGPQDHLHEDGVIRCRSEFCNGEPFPCHRRQDLEHWLFVPDVPATGTYRGTDAAHRRRPRPIWRDVRF